MNEEFMISPEIADANCSDDWRHYFDSYNDFIKFEIAQKLKKNIDCYLTIDDRRFILSQLTGKFYEKENAAAGRKSKCQENASLAYEYVIAILNGENKKTVKKNLSVKYSILYDPKIGKCSTMKTKIDKGIEELRQRINKLLADNTVSTKARAKLEELYSHLNA